MRHLRNHLGAISHIVAGLLPLTWSAILVGGQPHPVLIVFAAFFALLPDVDTTASHVGRLFPYASEQIERRWGHRTLTHSLLAVAAIALFTWLIFRDGWIWLTAAYGTHLLVDMIVGAEGVPLLWPGSWRFFIAQIPAASTGEVVATGSLALALMLPLLWPAFAFSTAEILPKPPPPTLTPTPTPKTVTIRIPHVYDPNEVLIEPGDTITTGQLIADLVTYRRLIATPTPTLTPTPGPTPTPANLNPATVAQAEAELSLAEARHAAAIATPTPDPILLVTLREEQTAVNNGIQDRRDALHRCQQENACDDWRYQLAAQELAELEARATEISQQLNAELYPQPDALAVKIAEAQLALAETRHAAAVATPTPASPTATPRPVDPPRKEINDETRIHALIAGHVVEVRIAAVTGNEAVVEILVEPVTK